MTSSWKKFPGILTVGVATRIESRCAECNPWAGRTKHIRCVFSGSDEAHGSNVVMPGLVPGIHVLCRAKEKTWMAGTSPAMTKKKNRPPA
jgi:hypothetical protein